MQLMLLLLLCLGASLLVSFQDILSLLFSSQLNPQPLHILHQRGSIWDGAYYGAGASIRRERFSGRTGVPLESPISGMKVVVWATVVSRRTAQLARRRPADVPEDLAPTSPRRS